MRTGLQALAVLIAAGVILFWATTGAHSGWTKNKVEVRVQDEVTGIESSVWKDKFVPGLDFLSVGLGGAALLAGAAFLFRKQIQNDQINKR